jgi:hypothetical protein
MSPLERKPDAGKPHVRFDERGVETKCMTGYSGTGNRKGRTPATAWPKHHRATPRLYKYRFGRRRLGLESRLQAVSAPGRLKLKTGLQTKF